MAVGDVEGVVIEGEIGHVTDVECRVVVSAGPGGGAGHVDLRLLHVDAVQLTRSNRGCQTDGNGTRSTTEVEDAQAGLEVG